jgi:hypothetical protein
MIDNRARGSSEAVSEHRKNKKYWQARIEITQLPSLPKDPLKSINKYEQLTSWLADPFSDHNRVYCMELQMGIKFKLILYITEDSRKNARIRGYMLLTYLEDKHPGLAGKLSVVACAHKEIEDTAQIYELKFPEFKPHPSNRFMVFKRMVALSKYITSNIQFFIFWHSIREPLAKYSVKLFLKINPTGNGGNGAQPRFDEILGRLNYVCMEFRRNREYGKWIYKNPKIWSNLRKSEVFKNTGSNCTGDIPNFDFFFFPEIPLQKTHYLHSENIFESLYAGNTKLLLGNYVKNGVVNAQKICMNTEDFGNSVLIGGVPNTGKTTFLSQICHEFARKNPDVGLLIINTAKEHQEDIFPIDRIIRYGAPDCKVPYYVEGRFPDKCIQKTADYLAGALGFEEPINKILQAVMDGFKTRDNLPHSLLDLFYGLVRWFEINQYHVRYQTDILQAFNNRTKALFTDPCLSGITSLGKGYIPAWFREWQSGKNIFFDLFPANLYSRRLIANGIFQMVWALTPGEEQNILKYLICIDEAHNLVANAKGNISEEEMVSRRQLGNIFRTLMQEFRGKGVSFITVDQTPSDLIDCVTRLPGLKFLFRVGKEDIERFADSLEEREFIKHLPNRKMLVLNNNLGERFVMKTIDSNFKRNGR